MYSVGPIGWWMRMWWGSQYFTPEGMQPILDRAAVFSSSNSLVKAV